MVKPFKNLLLRNQQADLHETWYVASGLQPIIACSNDDPRVTLTYFTARSFWLLFYGKSFFYWEKVKTVDFAETIAACDLKIGRCRQLIEIINVGEY